LNENDRKNPRVLDSTLYWEARWYGNCAANNRANNHEDRFIMKKFIFGIASVFAIIGASTAQADRVKGSAKADFATDELSVPCVLIENYSSELDGQYVDLVLDRRGESFNYELTFAEPEDSAMCQEMANYSVFIDDDFTDDDSSDDSTDDDSTDDDSTDDDSTDDDSTGASNLFVNCEVRSDRSKGSIDGKNLAAGEYYAVLSSGENSLTSQVKSNTGDEVEFDFDSDPDDIAEGAEAIDSTFIEGNSVIGEIFDATTDELVLSESASCRVRD
jgi:hypothetical protein